MFRHGIRILLRPGIGFKRWAILLVIGVIFFGLGFGFFMAEPLSPKVMPLLRTITLGGAPPALRGAIFMGGGAILALAALVQTYRLLISGAILGRGRVDVLTALDRKRRHGQGLKVVAIGGGTGISTLLRGLKQKTSNLTAIVTTSDDGGSSGRLREDLGMPPPGDARNCLIALSQDETLLEELFMHRFAGGSSLNGHSLGNLLLAALYEIHGGFQESLKAASQLLALSGEVIPVSTDSDLILNGETVSGEILTGESAVGNSPQAIDHVWIEPTDSDASPLAIQAIEHADLIVIGPGSLYTSVIPNFLLRGVPEAVFAASCPKIFVCNVATQPHETDGYDVKAHIDAFKTHAHVNITHVLVNSNFALLPTDLDQKSISPIANIPGFAGKLVLRDVVDETFRTRHDPEKLATALLKIARS